MHSLGTRNLVVLFFVLASALAANAQFGDILRKGRTATDKAKKVADATAVWTAEQEKAIGEASAAKLVQIFGLYDNPAMTHYVNLVGHALAAHSSRVGSLQYRFGILDTEAITAFGIPGGYVFVTRGAIANMKDESELAGALAHEIAHVDNRHLEKEIRAKKMTKLATSEGMDQLGNRVPMGGLLKEVANEIVTQAVTTSYGRDKEEEADRKGTELAASAGYDAAGLRNFLETIEKAKQNDAEAERRLGVWGSTHPPLSERVANLTAIAGKLPGGQMQPARYRKNASFGPTEEELAQMAAAKAAAEKREADRIAAEKAAAGAKGKSKAKAKRPQ
jgi:beta-barrel assembly-enhancing protease